MTGREVLAAALILVLGAAVVALFLLLGLPILRHG